MRNVFLIILDHFHVEKVPLLNNMTPKSNNIQDGAAIRLFGAGITDYKKLNFISLLLVKKIYKKSSGFSVRTL